MINSGAPWKLRSSATAAVGAITAVEFDPDVELLWVADSYGSVMSFTVQAHPDMLVWSVYSSFSASTHPTDSISFVGTGAGEKMVIIPDREAIRGFKRGGVPTMCLPVPDTQNYIELFRANSNSGAMFFTGNAGLTRVMLHNDDTDQLTVPIGDSAIETLSQCDDWVATGSKNGSIVVRDSRDLEVVASVDASRSRVMALDVFDNTVVAALSEYSTSSLVKVYDIRKMDEAVNVVKDIPSGKVTQLRRYQDSFGRGVDKAFALTSQGFHIVQLDQEKPIFGSGSLIDGVCTAVSVSPSRMCAVVGSNKGEFFALAHPATKDEYVMSTFTQPQRPKPRTFTQSWVEANAEAGFDSCVPSHLLASSWPPDDYMILTVPQKLRCANLELNTVLQNQWELIRADSYLPDPKDKMNFVLPNPCPFNTQLGSDPCKAQEILLEMRKDMKRKHKLSRGGGGEYSPMDDALQVCYSMQHKVDWKSYNELPHKAVGLDNSFPECWMTSLLQSLYLCQPPHYPIRKVIMRHLCKREFCMTCEINFIFSNVATISLSFLGSKDTTLAPIAQVGHLIRTMKQIRAFTSSEVFQKPKSRDDAVAKMHLLQRLVLEMLHKDLLGQKAYPFNGYQSPAPDYEDSIASLFGTEFTSNGRVHVEPRFFWEVPGSALKVDEGLQHLLKQLEAYNDQVQIKRLPPIIVLLLNPEHSNLNPPSSLKISRAGKEDYNYVLNSNIIHLADDVDDTGNFVSHQRIKDDTFALVNDYRVTAPMKIQDLERFIPALRSYSAVVAFYALDSLGSPLYAPNEETRPLNMWTTLGPLLTNDFLSKPLLRDPAKQQFRSPLASYTDIKSGDLVAIDAEYVVLKWASKEEESDFYSLQKKQHMGLARVSCLLSSEENDERTIVDDYVHIPEEIEDYVTQYSGIHPGDLDPLQSTKSLTSLKATYLKLRALVDGGAIFVGHGLSQDFRVCNIAVPKKQIIDTLEIYHKSGARYLSLRFLAYHVLGERVQEDEHDSIEDARTSLRLYRRYMQLKREGTFESVLDELMAKGAETSWYVPDSKSAFRDTPVTPPASLMGSPVFKLPSTPGLGGEGDDTTEDADESECNSAAVTAAQAAATAEMFAAVQMSIAEDDK